LLANMKRRAATEGSTYAVSIYSNYCHCEPAASEKSPLQAKKSPPQA
jgi:hypothetical protein